MAKTCCVCNRGPKVGYQLSHSHRRSKRRWNINLQRKQVMVAGKLTKGYVCTRCMGSEKATHIV